MKQILSACLLSLICSSAIGQTNNTTDIPTWKKHLRRTYIELDAGALFILSFGANANLGYQFHPLMGLGATASAYSELSDFFGASWRGWGMHYRGTYKKLIWRLDYCIARGAERSDDSPYCGTWEMDAEQKNQYLALSVGYRLKVFKLGLNVSRASLHLLQPCEGMMGPNRQAPTPIAFVPMLGISFGGKGD